MPSPNEIMFEMTTKILESINNLANSNIILAKSLDNFTQHITKLNHNVEELGLCAKQMGAFSSAQNLLGQLFKPPR